MNPSNEDALIRQNTKLVHKVMQGFKIKPCDYEDTFQAGCIGLLKAIRGFTASKGFQFSTYAWKCILGEIIREVNKPKHDHTKLDDSSISYTQEAESWEFLPALTPEELEIVELRSAGFKLGDIRTQLNLNNYEFKKRLKSVRRKMENGTEG